MLCNHRLCLFVLICHLRLKFLIDFLFKSQSRGFAPEAPGAQLISKFLGFVAAARARARTHTSPCSCDDAAASLRKMHPELKTVHFQFLLVPQRNLSPLCCSLLLRMSRWPSPTPQSPQERWHQGRGSEDRDGPGCTLPTEPLTSLRDEPQSSDLLCDPPRSGSPASEPGIAWSTAQFTRHLESSGLRGPFYSSK